MSILMRDVAPSAIDINDAKRFLKLIFAHNKGLVEIREVVDSRSIRHLFLDGFDQFEHFTPSPNANVFVGMFTRKKRNGKKESCLTTMSLWMDYDGLSLEQVQKNISTAGLPEPSVWVHSGHGIHTYWLLDKPSSKGVANVLKAIADVTGGDPSVTDIARVMRLPGTLNVKREPVPCRIIKTNGIRYSLQSIAEAVGVDIDAAEQLDKLPTEKVSIPELSNSPMACLRLIGKGVGKGHRNFALGKIVALLKLHGYSKTGALALVTRWNKSNTPPKPYIELRNEFERFWIGDYKYLGCSFSDPRLNTINEQLCSMGDCEHHIQQQMQIVNHEDQTLIDNEIYKDTVFPRIKGLELAIYSILSQEKEIERDRLLDLLKRNKKDKSFPVAIQHLKSLGYVDVKKSGNRNGQLIVLKTKDNYGRGYTVFNSLLWRVYIAKEIGNTEYKLLALLKWYAYSKRIVYPTVSTMARKIGVTERTIENALSDLESKAYIKRDYKPLQNGGIKLFVQLKF